ncbi:MAG: hypothetical protein JWR35_1864 [Marmoricola sp.]|jgi:endonuclease/exonuclease/phosphatase family metal-dependent hydrolase|nr:hypothetical protein [Marmoricola sp.]
MLRRLPRLLALVVCGALALVGLAIAPSNAAAVPKVFGMTIAKQDWYNAKLTVRWKAVPGATYRLRWARNSKMTGATTPLTTRTAAGTLVGPLDRGTVWYFQARAVKKGKVGAWSSAKRAPFINKFPTTPTPSAEGVPGGVRISWPYSAYASRYRVRWSEGAHGEWPAAPAYVDHTAGGWVGQTARSSTLLVPTNAATDSSLTAVAYANPIFAQVEANNAYVPGSHFSTYVMAFPTPPAPDPGDPVRMGTYNVMSQPTTSTKPVQIAGLAKNIKTHLLNVVALQEAFGQTATDLATALGPTWETTHSPGSESQIIFDSAAVALSSDGTFGVHNNASNATLQMPWAQFTAVNPTVPGHAQPFYVVSVHFSVTSAKSLADQNAQTGQNASDLMPLINAQNTGDNPVIIAGDFTSNREPYGDPHPAEPTFVRAGYYDAMAALAKTDYRYSTFNNTPTTGVPQTATKSGLGTRADYIVFKGFRGAASYTNVANWTSNGGVPTSHNVPSDHNLVFADLAIPETP